MKESAIVPYMNKFVTLADDEAAEVEASFEHILVKKRQLIVQPFFTVSHRYYVLSGAFRSYVIDESGQEHTISLAIDDWWITDYNSYIFQRPATLYVVALENSAVLRLSYTKEKELKEKNHKYETFFRIIAERGLAYHQRRLISNLTETAEERYRNFTDKYSMIVQRVPQYAVASFLGMTTEYFSKLRKRQFMKKHG